MNAVTPELNKAMKLISKISTSSLTINLIEFYKTGNEKQQLLLSENFEKILKEATSDSETVELYNETFYQFQNTKMMTDSNAMEVLNEAVIDLGTALGRLEVRKRLGALAYFFMQQSNGEEGDLIIDGNSNILGSFKTISGLVLVARAYLFTGSSTWVCYDGGFNDMEHEGRMFWSRIEQINT